MDKLSKLKAQFDSEVNESHIQYAWDGGWCYTYIDHPVMELAENELDEDNLDYFQCHTDEWLSEHEGALYHMSDVVGGKLVNQAEELEGEEAKEYARGLIGLLEKCGSKFYTSKLEELNRFIGDREFEQQVLVLTTTIEED